jgi:hypothetical protein
MLGAAASHPTGFQSNLLASCYAAMPLLTWAGSIKTKRLLP